MIYILALFITYIFWSNYRWFQDTMRAEKQTISSVVLERCRNKLESPPEPPEPTPPEPASAALKQAA
jgi:hypothetical protein